MNEQAASLAAQNVPLLEAIKAGPVDGPTALAARYDGDPRHVNRKLASLLEAGLIEKTGEGSCDVRLTDDGERALTAMAVFRGETLGGDVTEIPADLIDAWPDQPRTQFSAEFEEELANSIADKGVLQPLTVRPVGDRYQAVIGENRRRASQRAIREGWVSPSFPIPCRVRDLDDDEAFEVALAENTQREDLHWMDEAQAFLRLHQTRGKSAAEIMRISGTKRKKRSVQDLIKIARELPAELIARCYKGDGDKDQLSYVQARDLVGEKKEKPALALSPKLTVAFLEAIYSGLKMSGTYAAELRTGSKVHVRFFKAPVGGPFASLQHDQKLIAFGFHDFGDGARVVAGAIQVTDDVLRWLKQIGFDTEPDNALRIARAAIVGDMQAAAMHRDGRYFADELNAPEPAPAPAPTPAPASDDDDDFDPDFDDEVDDEDIPESLRRLAGPGPAASPAAAPAPAPAPEPEAQPLPPMLEIVLIELAHAIGSSGGIERTPGDWGAPVLADFHRDTRGSQLVQKHAMVRFLPHGLQTLCHLTQAGRDYLFERLRIGTYEGRPKVPLVSLMTFQEERVGAIKQGAPLYSTPWLNLPPAAAPATPTPPAPELAGTSAGEAPVSPALSPPPTAAPGAVTREQRVIANLDSVVDKLERMVGRLRAKANRETQQEIDQLRALAEAARDAAKPYLPEGL